MRIMIAGDFCPQRRMAQVIESGDFSSVLGQVQELVSAADYSIVNFECAVTKGGEIPIVKQGPNLRCSEKGLDILKWAGFNCVTLANNHFYDYGDEGARNTIERCATLGLDVVGGGMDVKEASTVLYKIIGGKTVAIINCCEHEFSIADDTHGGSNPLNPIRQYYSVVQAKERADYVLVIVHGGHEHWQLPSPRMQETYRFFIDAGADAVVNHHQHCYSGYEIYRGKPIFYGLGNFCFDRAGNWGEKWHEGFLLMLTFDEKGIGHEIFPYHQCLEHPTVELLEKGSFDERLMELNSIILDKERLIEETRKYYARERDKMSKVFEPCDSRFYLAGKRRGLFPSLISKKRKLLATDLICCESHRDKMYYFLKEEL